MADVKSIETTVHGIVDLVPSVLALINGIADLLNGLTHDPVAIQRAATELKSNAPALAAAVVANTKASPESIHAPAESEMSAKKHTTGHAPAHPTPAHKPPHGHK